MADGISGQIHADNSSQPYDGTLDWAEIFLRESQKARVPSRAPQNLARSRSSGGQLSIAVARHPICAPLADSEAQLFLQPAEGVSRVFERAFSAYAVKTRKLVIPSAASSRDDACRDRAHKSSHQRPHLFQPAISIIRSAGTERPAPFVRERSYAQYVLCTYCDPSSSCAAFVNVRSIRS
jgi:hypothetical protein